MRIIVAAALLTAALSGCTNDEGMDGIARATPWALGGAAPAGPPVDCVDQAAIRGHAVRDDRTIDFSMADGRLLRNRLPFACPGLTAASRFTYRTALPRLCNVDQITLVRPDGRAGGSCGLGMFQPVALPPAPPAGD